MTATLRNLRISEVSFCRKGMNPGAKVALFKSADPAVNREEDSMFDKSKLDAGALAAFNELEAKLTKSDADLQTSRTALTAATASVTTLTTERDDLKKSVTTAAAVAAAADPIAKAKAAGASPEVIAAMESQGVLIKAQNETLQKVKTAEDRRVMIGKADVAKLVVEPKDIVDVLLKVEAATDTATADKVLEILGKAANAVAAAKGGTTAEIGTGNGGNANGNTRESVMTKVNAAATELKKANPALTDEAARSKVFEAQPALYAEYLNAPNPTARAA